MTFRSGVSASAAAVLALTGTGVAWSVAHSAPGESTGTAATLGRTANVATHDAGDGHAHDHERPAGITSGAGGPGAAAFDLVRTVVRREGDDLVFVERVSGRAGARTPRPTGEFAGSKVLSYVWPTSLDPRTVGFARGSGVLALAATSHPDFDDTPLYDENNDGATDNDGRGWHAHWVVLVPDTTREDGALKVRDIPEGATPPVPDTWPGAPILLDSPDYPTRLGKRTVRIVLPLSDVGGRTTFRYDGVTAALKVSADLHDPLLRVTNVFDVASGELSLPGTVVTDR